MDYGIKVWDQIKSKSWAKVTVDIVNDKGIYTTQWNKGLGVPDRLYFNSQLLERLIKDSTIELAEEKGMRVHISEIQKRFPKSSWYWVEDILWEYKQRYITDDDIEGLEVEDQDNFNVYIVVWEYNGDVILYSREWLQTVVSKEEFIGKYRAREYAVMTHAKLSESYWLFYIVPG
jgi:intein-encoded DNA endonuclease-like protein